MGTLLGTVIEVNFEFGDGSSRMPTAKCIAEANFFAVELLASG